MDCLRLSGIAYPGFEKPKKHPSVWQKIPCSIFNVESIIWKILSKQYRSSLCCSRRVMVDFWLNSAVEGATLSASEGVDMNTLKLIGTTRHLLALRDHLIRSQI